MTETSAPRSISTPPRSSEPPKDAETFGRPGVTGAQSLTDGRAPGDWESRYPCRAWVHIAAEGLVLVGSLLASVWLLIELAKKVVIGAPHAFLPWLLGNPPADSAIWPWTAVALSGVCGGCAASLKWLYHSVAKGHWHCDRVVWRLTVPLQGGVLAVFTGLMIVSEIVPFLSRASFAAPATGAAFGFFIGFFSDYLLGALHNFALQVFGTLERRRSGTGAPPER